MKFFKRIFFWLSGAGTESLETCPNWEQRKYVAFGATVLVPTVFAFIACSYALSTITDNWRIIFGVSLAWGFIIMTVDRALLSTYRSYQKWHKKLGQFALRFVVAMLMGLTISHPLTLLLFKDTIQSVVDDSTFEFGVLNMTDAVGDTVKLTSRSTIKCRPMPLSATLDGNHVDFEYKGSSGWLTIGTIAMTEIKIPSNQATTHANLKGLLVHIKHRDNWDAFTVATLNEDEVKWRVKGTIKVTASLAGVNLVWHHVKINKSIVTQVFFFLRNCPSSGHPTRTCVLSSRSARAGEMPAGRVRLTR